MRIHLHVEGNSDRGVLPNFFKRWLALQNVSEIRVTAEAFDGASKLARDSASRAELQLRLDPDLLGVLALLDYKGSLEPGCPVLGGCPQGLALPEERIAWARDHLQEQISMAYRHRYRVHFALHDLEAWMLADPACLPAAVSRQLRADVQPEKVNAARPPKHVLGELYQRHVNQKYSGVQASRAFERLDPLLAAERCTQLRACLNSLLDLARPAGGVG